jgi:hypothetical protein
MIEIIKITNTKSIIYITKKDIQENFWAGVNVSYYIKDELSDDPNDIIRFNNLIGYIYINQILSILTIYSMKRMNYGKIHKK